MSRFKYHVFVCENRRPPDDPKGCCSLKGSNDILERLRELVKVNGLNSKIRINSSGCLSNCARGPALVVYPGAIWYSHVNVEDAQDIFESHLQNDVPLARLLDPVFHPVASKGGM